MSVTKKQKSKAFGVKQKRRPGEADLISDLESLDIIIESDHYEREDSDVGNSVRSPESPRYDALIDHNSY